MGQSRTPVAGGGAAADPLRRAADPVARLLDRARTAVRPGAGVAAPPPAEGVSLCMIVRDEERHLERCLTSAAPIVQEIVVADTGSRDRSREIARGFGARVLEIAWERDFARARNASLEAARCPWILVLDADEAIATADHGRFRELIRAQRSAPAGFSIRTRNYTCRMNVLGWEANAGEYPAEEAGTGWFPSEKVRLFPNDPRIRFVHAVHEVVEPTLAALGVPVVRCDIPVHHYGKLEEDHAGRKTRIYREIEIGKLRDSGGSPAALRELAVQAAELGRHAEAAGLWRRLLALAPGAAEAHVNLGTALFNLGRYDEAARSAAEAVRLAPHLKEARFNLAMAELHLGRAAEAAGGLARLLEQAPDYAAARFLAAAALGACGRAEEGLQVLAPLRAQPVGAFLAVSFLELARRIEAAGHGGLARQAAEVAVRGGFAQGALGAWIAAADAGEGAARRPAPPALSPGGSAPKAPCPG
jgi:tetratricopeptide (TPR) repeat protein